jgi:methyl-accepting chemotaxis protein
MESWQIAVTVILALLVGALLPLIVMLTLTVGTLRKQIVSTGRRLDDGIEAIGKGVEEIRSTVAEVHVSATRLAAFSQSLEGADQSVKGLLSAVEGVSVTLEEINTTTRRYANIISMVAPAVTAFIGAMRQGGVETGEAAAAADTPREDTP